MAEEELVNAHPEEPGETKASGQAQSEEIMREDPGGAGPFYLSDSEPDDHNAPLSLTLETAAEENQPPALPYPVVAFGASAGGLQAFREILEHLDPNTGMALVLISHLAPNQKSFLSEIVERYTLMPVLSIVEGQRPEPNHLYVLQPNQILTLRDGQFHVAPPPARERFPRTIDTFFYSLAADQKNHAIGVILSGADGDGALGLKAIKGEGGISLVQTPDSAVHSGMPRSSIAADHIDLIIPPKEIALELGRLAQQFARPEVRSLEDGGAISQDEEQAFQKILLMLRSLSGLDLRQYKPETIRRRIARRMLLQRMDHLSDYLRYLHARGDELRNLQEDVLINVTRFFRDPHFWESFSVNVLPVLTQDRSPGRPIRVWCAGCSTGEEAYSLAISILEHLSHQGLETPVQIFGTDASDQAIETARFAVYPDTIAAEVSSERLRRYFIKVDRGYQVNRRVRDTCIFARQNLCCDPPFSHVEVLSCRNVMIYFNQPLQRQIMLTFHYALEPAGYMLLGMSEGLRDYGDVFSTVDRKHKIYMKTGSSLLAHYNPPRNYALTRDTGTARHPLALENQIWPELELQRAADRIVLGRFGPPGLIIDEHFNVIQSRGQASQFLEITPGAVTWSLVRVLRQSLVSEVLVAAQRAVQENIPASTTAVIFEEQNGEQQIKIDVLPINSGTARPRCFLILFQQLAKSGDVLSPELPAPAQLSVDEKDRLIAQLRQDLNTTRFNLQSLVEERDARNQELVSANEEIQSANEELQSTNEELETTKEELQSTNEELQTVNDELQQRNNVLTQTGDDLNNLLNSVNIPLLMLTSDLRIRQFTPPMQRLLNVRASDMGRPIREIRLQLSLEDITPVLNEVLETLTPREFEVQDRENRWHQLRVKPYRTTANKIEGLVVVLVDIDDLRKSQLLLTDARDFSRSVVETVSIPIVVLNQDCTIRTANTAFRTLTRLSAEELDQRPLPELASDLWGIPGMREKLTALVQSPPGAVLEFEHESSTALHKTLLVKAHALNASGGRELVIMLEDVTLRREAERLITRHTHALEGEIETVARDLNRAQDELRGLTGHLFSSQEDERQHLARELHDDISQRLSLLEMLLEEITGAGCEKEDVERLTSALKQVHSLNTDVRQMSHRLHPAILTDLGLSPALKSLVTEFGKREKMPATYQTQDLPEGWPPLSATAIYRIAQEALHNVAKHAGKTHVKVILAGVDGRLQLKVMDFGVGFDQESDNIHHGLGMISMQERARLAGGRLTVQSALGHGTTVTVDVPLEYSA